MSKKHKVQRKVEKQTDYKPKTQPSLDWLSCKLKNNFHTKSFLTEFFDLNSNHFDIQTIKLRDKVLKDGTLQIGNTIIKYSNGFIWLEFPQEADQFVKLTITSAGFSIYFLENDLDKFLQWIYKNSPVHEDQYGINYISGITRIDIAYDDTTGLIPMSRIYKWVRNRQVKTRLNYARPQYKISLKTGKRTEGFTWYLGERENSLFIRFYDKAAMQRELKIKLEDEVTICNRMEFELKDKLANELFSKYVSEPDFDFREFFQDKISFKWRSIEPKEPHKERIEDADEWAEFMHFCEPHKLSLPKDRYNYDTLRIYMEKKVASALGTYLAINGDFETILEEYAKKKESGKLNLKHMQLLDSNPIRLDSEKSVILRIKKIRKAS
ncbi:MAG: replication initiation factor domain-containing protein [Leptospiraceae bacterium]|nr:replication initiation factor domain-containing protein [Leptospiraceae bacterium]